MPVKAKENGTRNEVKVTEASIFLRKKGEKFQQQWKKHPLALILVFSLFIRLMYIALNYPLWWDSHIYISIGKYIFSSGEIGIWESFRPLLHPFLLGIFWKLGFNPIRSEEHTSELQS